jgi:hypothetical protein
MEGKTKMNIRDMATQSDGSYVYVARENGLYRSSNSLWNWDGPVIFPSGFINPPRLVAMAADNPHVVAVCDSKANGNQIWLSHDYGNSWLNLGVPKPGSGMTYTDLAVTKELAAGRWVFVTVADNTGGSTQKGDIMMYEINQWHNIGPMVFSCDYMAVQPSPNIQQDSCITVIGATTLSGVYYRIIKPSLPELVQDVLLVGSEFTGDFRSSPAGHSIICADIALMPDFRGDIAQFRKAFSCLTTANYSMKDGVYKIADTSAVKKAPASSTTGMGYGSLDIRADLLLVGEYATNKVRRLMNPWTSNTWFGCNTYPTGQKQAIVGVNAARCFAGTTGGNSGLFFSINNGNQFIFTI